ncbi:SDR family NAD(P)-dependent oxidoreductase [Rhodococcus rhodnii]|nr:SDR family NAD(P)-dependent oxidoreductase [Rhodococcus rhodnii]TXG92343.1 SDR family NAD(P)-dependent oxidoreductase [Rhodococcus rhodnii]
MDAVALVTGASRGVGKGIATALGAAGWTVYVTGRNREALDDTVAAVNGGGGTGVAITCDHRDDAQIEAVFGKISGESGRLDLLVNNVWANPDGFAGFSDPFWKRPVSDWDSLIGVGLRAHYVASTLAARIMVPQGSGLVANISSFGTRGYLHSVLYGMSKAGLDKMAHDMAVELQGTGVNTVSLWPGIVRTEVVLAMGVDDIEGFPVANAESPEFVGRVVASLAADPAVAEYSGRTLVTAEAAQHYGITDEGGNRPPSHREAFGGGAVIGVDTRFGA